ncbi:unnamed protein product, partial [Ilex paraguariensis]
MAVQTGEMSKAGTNFGDFSSQQRLGSQEKIENNSSVLKRSCKRCGVVNTPIWRKGPDGSQIIGSPMDRPFGEEHLPPRIAKESIHSAQSAGIVKPIEQ